MNSKKQRLFESLAAYLGATLGQDYEVVVHSVNQDKIENSEIIAIENGHISRRTIHSPLTDLALEMIKNKDYERMNFKTNYKAITQEGTITRGSTYFIKDDEGNLEGLLCINHDQTRLRQLANSILDYCNDVTPDATEEANESTEMLSSSVEDIVNAVIDPVFLNEEMVLSPKQKEAAISKLYDKGVFSMKGSVQKVAKLLHMSEPTVYRYLKELS